MGLPAVRPRRRPAAVPWNLRPQARPVADVAEYREYAAQAQCTAESDGLLSAFAHVVAGVHPRPGREQQTVESLRSRARQLLDR